jgi:hypothetical protein
MLWRGFGSRTYLQFDSLNDRDCFFTGLLRWA